MYDPSVPCKKCGNKVPASSLKMDLDEQKMICPECIKSKKVRKEIAKEVYRKEETKEAFKEEPRAQKTRQKCGSCGYVFSVNLETKTPKNCPYCNERVLNY